MKSEQLELVGKVIQFPKNRDTENKLLKDKLKVAYAVLKTLTDLGADFHIIIEKEYAEELFTEEMDRNHVIFTSNIEKAKELELRMCIFPIKGNEF